VPLIVILIQTVFLNRSVLRGNLEVVYVQVHFCTFFSRDV